MVMDRLAIITFLLYNVSCKWIWSNPLGTRGTSSDEMSVVTSTTIVGFFLPYKSIDGLPSSSSRQASFSSVVLILLPCCNSSVETRALQLSPLQRLLPFVFVVRHGAVSSCPGRIGGVSRLRLRQHQKKSQGVVIGVEHHKLPQETSRFPLLCVHLRRA